MYTTDFICTYKMMTSDEDKEHLYRIQMLQAFNIEEWNDKVIEETMNELLQKVRGNEQFRFILDTAKVSPKLGMMLTLAYQRQQEKEDKIDAYIFIMLFNYDYFDMFHRCICEHINEGRIKRETYEKIMNKL
jgi:hypothetical protein